MTTNLKRAISRITDMNELHELTKHINERRKLLFERKLEAERAEAWARVKVLPAGTFLYCCAKGTFFGGPFQRGDKFMLVEVRRRTIVLEHGEKGRWTFPALQVYRYDLRTEPPEQPMSAEHRAQVERVAERIASVA